MVATGRKIGTESGLQAGSSTYLFTLDGWPIDEAASDDGWVQLASDAGATVSFQRVEDYQPPQWPGQDHPFCLILQGG